MSEKKTVTVNELLATAEMCKTYCNVKCKRCIADDLQLLTKHLEKISGEYRKAFLKNGTTSLALPYILLKNVLEDGFKLE